MVPPINHSKSLILLCALIILLSNPAHAESGIDLFEETSITPPSLEDAEIDTGTIKLILELKDINTKEPLTDIHLNIELISVTRSTKTIKYIGDNNILELNLPREDWIIILKGDLLSTTGKDYYAAYTIDLDADTNQTIYLLPVGSVEGMVYTDREQTQVVEGAILKFDCSADYGEPKDMATDTFGSFKSEWLPATTCRIYAKHGNQVGSTEVTISPGTLSNTQIILDKDTVVKDNKIQLLLAAAGLILLALFIVRLSKYSSKTPKKEQYQAPNLPKRTKDIINTLNQKEKSIVTFLLENNNESTQNKIYHSTFIPKTSLSRSLLLLEQKRIIKIEKLGNLRKIKLTGWFLDKK
ncbi:MAG: hypothetical protein KAH93_05515 [Candidatus Aenigmarchaeota archaeon]|nr:hypothetical protein [Candidatus Aenigmarchaeota archaeon]